MSLVIGLLGGTLGGAVVTQLFAIARGRAEADTRRRSQARLLHEDFLHQQSTVARAYYRSATRERWWNQEEFFEPLATAAVYTEVLGALETQEYVAVASAIGWMQYFRAAREANQPAPSRAQLCDVYRKLATARYALAKLGAFDYRPHEHAAMRDDQPLDDGLTVTEGAARAGLDEAPNERAIAPVPGMRSGVIQTRQAV